MHVLHLANVSEKINSSRKYTKHEILTGPLCSTCLLIKASSSFSLVLRSSGSAVNGTGFGIEKHGGDGVCF